MEHLIENFMEIETTFTPHFMTLFVYLTPLEIATRLFEIFILDGEQSLIKVILRMIDLKKDEIMRREDQELQRYILSDMIQECVEEFSIGHLLDDA